MLRAKKAKYKYKSENSWLNAVYRNNKGKIDKALSAVREKNKLKLFKQLVYERQEVNGESAYKAVQNLSKTEVFVSRKERAQKNLLEALKKDKETFKQFRKYAGWSKKINENKFEWDYDDNVYKYDGITIDITNSPYGINVYVE